MTPLPTPFCLWPAVSNPVVRATDALSTGARPGGRWGARLKCQKICLQLKASWYIGEGSTPVPCGDPSDRWPYLYPQACSYPSPGRGKDGGKGKGGGKGHRNQKGTFAGQGCAGVSGLDGTDGGRKLGQCRPHRPCGPFGHDLGGPRLLGDVIDLHCRCVRNRSHVEGSTCFREAHQAPSKTCSPFGVVR